MEAHHGIGRAAGHFGVICKRCCRSHTSGRPRSDASMHRRAAHGTAGACSIASMHTMKTCVRRRLRGIAHARWVQGNVGSADDPHRLALSASKTRHTGAQAHARRDNDGPRILERGVDDPLNLDENPRRRRAYTVLTLHWSRAAAVTLVWKVNQLKFYNTQSRSIRSHSYDHATTTIHGLKQL